MRLVELSVLEQGTAFKWRDVTYIKGSKGWFLDGKDVYSCHPRLGGKFQTKLEEWIPIDELVQVSTDDDYTD